MIIDAATAIQSLLPNANGYTTIGNKIVQWEDPNHNQPTEKEIVQEIAKLEYEQEVNQYQLKRAEEYPSWGKQLDYIYHNGIDAWKTDIVDPVKTKYPKQTVDSDEMDTRKAQALFDYQLAEYTKAVTRLDQYQVANGRVEVTEMQDGPNQLTDSDGALQFDSDRVAIYEQVEVITVTAIDPLPATVTQTQYDSDGTATEVEVTNPLITKDSEERAAAQAIVDATPQPVIDEYNS